MGEGAFSEPAEEEAEPVESQPPPQQQQHRLQQQQQQQRGSDGFIQRLLVEWWRRTDASLKWPVAIFLPLYLLVTLAFGPSVSSDLTPLWLIGPLLLSLSLLLLSHLSSLSLALLQRTTERRQLALSYFRELLAYAKSGRLPEDAQMLLVVAGMEVRARGRRVLDSLERRKGELVVYVESGRMAEEVGNKVERWGVERWEELCDWTMERGEDASDWMRVFKRKAGKVLGKVF